MKTVEPFEVNRRSHRQRIHSNRKTPKVKRRFRKFFHFFIFPALSLLPPRSLLNITRRKPTRFAVFPSVFFSSLFIFNAPLARSLLAPFFPIFCSCRYFSRKSLPRLSPRLYFSFPFVKISQNEQKRFDKTDFSGNNGCVDFWGRDRVISARFRSVFAPFP